jgi:hypothetical protein
LACAICESRKEKRFCPAVHGRICPICCGTEREVTLDCPSDCPYLQQARQHERPRDLAELEPAALFQQVTIPQDLPYRREPLLMGLSYTLAQSGRRNRELNDRDLMAVLTSMAKSYETLVSSGLVYESPTANPAQQVIAAELQKSIEGYRQAEQKQLGYSTLRDSEILQALVFLLRLGLARTSGRPRSRAFLEFLYAQFPQKDSIIAGPQDAGSRLIVP